MKARAPVALPDSRKMTNRILIHSRPYSPPLWPILPCPRTFCNGAWIAITFNASGSDRVRWIQAIQARQADPPWSPSICNSHSSFREGTHVESGLLVVFHLKRQGIEPRGRFCLHSTAQNCPFSDNDTKSTHRLSSGLNGVMSERRAAIRSISVRPTSNCRLETPREKAVVFLLPTEACTALPTASKISVSVQRSLIMPILQLSTLKCTKPQPVIQTSKSFIHKERSFLRCFSDVFCQAPL
jgi:hypothetical protein